MTPKKKASPPPEGAWRWNPQRKNLDPITPSGSILRAPMPTECSLCKRKEAEAQGIWRFVLSGGVQHYLCPQCLLDQEGSHGG